MSWVILAAAHFGFQTLSDAFILPLFLPFSLHFPPKSSRWEALVFLEGFLSFFQFLGELAAAHLDF